MSNHDATGPRDADDNDFEPGMLPVDPDEGPIPPAIPLDPEHDRLVDPEA